MSTAKEDVGSPDLKGIPVSLISLLLLAASIGAGEVAGRLSGSEATRSYMVYFGVAYATWTYVFFFKGRYRFEVRTQRLLLFLALSIVGFAAAATLFPLPGGVVYRAVTVIVLSLPAVIELALNRPVFRRTPP